MKYPNSLTGNVIFVITNSCTYEITDAVCRWRNRALFCSIVFTVTLRTRLSVMVSQISDRLTSCSTACPGWDQKKHRNPLIRDVIICNIEIVFYSNVITVTQPLRHDISNTQPPDCCSTVCPAYSKGNIRTLCWACFEPDQCSYMASLCHKMCPGDTI